MSLKAASFVRAAIAQGGSNDDERRPPGFVDACLKRTLERVQVVAVFDMLDVPLGCLEALADVFAEDQSRRAGQRHLVGVIQIDDFAEAEMAGQAGRFVRDTLHQVAVRDDAEGVVVDDRVAWLVVGGCQVGLGDGQADTIREALAERSGGQLDAWRQAVLGVTGRLAAPLPEVFDLVE